MSGFPPPFVSLTLFLRTLSLGPVRLAFANDGRLLATSGWLTDGILAFSDGGRTVRRFADSTFLQIGVGPAGQVYGTQLVEPFCAVHAFSPDGSSRGLLTSTTSSDRIHALAVAPSGRLFVTFERKHRHIFQHLESNGRLLHEFWLTGYHQGYLTCDAEGRLYVPCEGDDTLKLVREDGVVLRSWPLGSRLVPRHVALGKDGRIWVCGRTL